MDNRDALAVMVKYPEPGCVKTRLAPLLTPEGAAELYRAFIEDIFTRVKELAGVDIVAFFYPKAREEDFFTLISGGVSLFPQRGDDLGERLYNGFHFLFELGYKRVCIIGSDSPDLPLDIIEESFFSLDDSDGEDVVIGPARDGGYCLIAMDKLHEAPFKSIDWSTDKVLAQTVASVKEAHLSPILLRPWYDIDEPEDLKLLKDNPKAPKSALFLKGKL